MEKKDRMYFKNIQQLRIIRRNRGKVGNKIVEWYFALNGARSLAESENVIKREIRVVEIFMY